jgi:competence protein ComEA
MKLTVIRFVPVLFGIGMSLSLFAAEQKPAPARRAAITFDAESRPKLDLNTADLKSLESVSVIGPDGARAIVAARPFATVDELDRVQGISAERLEQIRARVMVATPELAMKNPGITGAAATPRAVEPTTRAPAKEKIDVNTADLKTLEAIPAIGPEAAKAITAARPFSTMDELNRVKGISAEQLEHIRAELTVVPETSKKKNAKPAAGR